MGELYAGLDIGGQSVKGIVLDDQGRTRAESSRTTPASSGAKAVLGAISEALGELSAAGRIVSVGVGTPGGVDSGGVIAGRSCNIPGWLGTRLREEVSLRAGAPCAVRNDGNIAAYAEWAARGGKARGLLFLGMGTGIGAGYVEDGRILGGRDDRALEAGHFVIEPGGRPCACGVAGCAEAYASGPSIGRIAADLAEGRDAGLGSIGLTAASILLSRRATAEDFALFLEDSELAARARAGQAINAREVYEAYARGDRLGLFADAVMVEALARTAATCLVLLAPDLAVFGGGVIRGAPHLPGRVAHRVRGLAYRDAWESCVFETALLSHRAGLLGAAWYGAACAFGKEKALEIAGAAVATARG